MKTKLPLYLALLLLTQCSKCKNDPKPADPTATLPPATQTGANTFGCLVDGQVWLPAIDYGSNTLRVTYDPSYLGGALQVKAKRYTGPGKDVLQGITFGAAAVDKIGVYQFDLSGPNGVVYNDYNRPSPCRGFVMPNTTIYQKGTLTITRFDLAQGIISGTFNFVLAQPGCDTIRITQGRFDNKL